MKSFLAILETMWDWDAQTSSAGYTKTAPDFFRISPNNFSGGRLYYLTGLDPEEGLWCTSVCPELVSHPSQHGTPSVERLTRNMGRWLCGGGKGDKVLLVYGAVAQETFNRYRLERQKQLPQMQVIYLPHPANRTWTKEALSCARETIARQVGNWRLFLRRLPRDGSIMLDSKRLWEPSLAEETPLF